MAVMLNFNSRLLYSALTYICAFMKFIKITPPPDVMLPYLQTNPQNIKILKQKMSTPTTDTRLSDLNLLFSLYAYRAEAWGGARGDFPLTVFCSKKSNHAQMKS